MSRAAPGSTIPAGAPGRRGRDGAPGSGVSLRDSVSCMDTGGPAHRGHFRALGVVIPAQAGIQRFS